MLVYLDNCCYNRPYDEQSQPFDYTEWQKKYFANVNLEEFNQNAAEYDKLNSVKIRQVIQGVHIENNKYPQTAEI